MSHSNPPDVKSTDEKRRKRTEKDKNGRKQDNGRKRRSNIWAGE